MSLIRVTGGRIRVEDTTPKVIKLSGQGPQGPTGTVITNAGAWTTGTTYSAQSFVSQGGSSYLCAVGHTAGTFATDLAAGKWTLIAEKGAIGNTGATGPKGDTGDTGPQGSAGATGATGSQGPQGIQGVQGNPGVGITWQGTWSGSTTYALNDAVYKDGSTYISVQAANVNHDPATDTTNTWWAEVAIQGTQGPQGSAGATGSTGATGAQGPSGVIAVTAPITNTGTSTSATIGITTGTTSSTVATGDHTHVATGDVTGTLGPTGAALTISAGAVVTADLADSAVTSAKIADGTIVNADVSSSAAIADSKLNLSTTVSGTAISTSNKIVDAAAQLTERSQGIWLYPWGSGTQTLSANQVTWLKFVAARSLTIARMGFILRTVHAGSGSLPDIQIGIYTSSNQSSTTATDWTRVATTGTVGGANTLYTSASGGSKNVSMQGATGARFADLTSTYALVAGQAYYASFAYSHPAGTTTNPVVTTANQFGNPFGVSIGVGEGFRTTSLSALPTDMSTGSPDGTTTAPIMLTLCT